MNELFGAAWVELRLTIYRYVGNTIYKKGNYIVDAPPSRGAQWAARPFPLVSLLNMLQLYAAAFYTITKQLTRFQEEFSCEISKRGGDYVADSLEVCGATFFLDEVKEAIEYLSLRRTLEKIESLKIKFNTHRNITLEKLRGNYADLQEAIHADLRERKFIVIPFGLVEYYEQANLLDAGTDNDITTTNFPKAAQEFKEAGNCFATGNNSACVFHLMRAVEYGLRALAVKLRLRFKKNPKTIAELQDWGGIIQALEAKIEQIEKTKKRTRKRDEDLVFYHGAAAQFRHFKNAWRNHVMHTKESYNDLEAASVMRHVCEFIQHLAKNRVKE